MNLDTLLIEFVTEELPPNSLKELSEKFGQLISQGLQEKNIIGNDDTTVYATPRRLGIKILNVAEKSKDEKKLIKLMPSKIGFDENNQPTQALLKKLHSLNESAKSVQKIIKKIEKDQEILFIEKEIAGEILEEVLSEIIKKSINKLPIKKMMSYQLEDGWTSVNFVRPVKNLLIIYGSKTLKVSSLGIVANNNSFGHRFESKKSILTIDHADNYEKILFEDGGVIVNFNKRKEKTLGYFWDT